MKKIIVLAALVISAFGFSQKTINEGVITATQTISSPDEQVNMQLAMMGQMITTTWFKNDKSRSEMSNPMAGNTIVVMDGSANKMLMMVDNTMTGKKYMLNDLTPSEEKLKDIRVVESTDTKTILGYVCKKYDVTMMKNGTEVKIALYTSEKVPAKSQQAAGLGAKIKGYPMFMELKMNQMGAEIIIKSEVTEIKAEEVAEAKFDMTPLEGYEKTEQLGM
ncbi:MAG: hypothetical protein HRT69_10125 [Flavobacteriaceae bacterium]|nr:hypothetical protein [Flavobacteriaceae bacterium]